MRYLSLFLSILLLVACDDTVRSLPAGGSGHSGSGTILVTIGELATWAGGVGLVLFPLAFGLSFVLAFLKPFQTLLFEAIPCCFILLACGFGITWLGDNTWALAALLVLGVLFIVVRYRDALTTLLRVTFTRKAMRKPKTSTSSPV